MEDKKNNNKLTFVIAIAALALIGIISGTYAYFTSQATVTNTFTANSYETVIQRDLSNQDWLPGTVLSVANGDYTKLNVKNTGGTKIAVRAKISAESIVDKDDSTHTYSLTLPAADTTSGNVEDVIQKVFGTNWVAGSTGGWYYYTVALATNAETTNFITSLTFNPDTKNKATCTPEVSPNENNGSVSCESTQYDNAEYNLGITFETIQASAFSTWNAVNASTSAAITLSNAS